MSKKVRTRIAPSPTGNLHLGTVRTALYNQVFAARHGGEFLFRLEDTDRERSNEVYTVEIIEGFRWLGIEWHGEMVRQSTREAAHQKYIDQLIASKRAYRCYATKEELEAVRAAQRAAKQAEGYDNRGRHYTAADIEKFIAEGRTSVVRLNLDLGSDISRDIKWTDLVRGEMSVNTKDLGGDLVIQKADGQVLYNFAVVIDDLEMGVTHVLRGEDHLTNTAKQIAIYQALDAEVPQFGHLPLIFTADKQKLSKRKHGDIAGVDKYRREGYLPEALANYLLSTSYSPRPEHDLNSDGLFTMAEIALSFEMSGVSKSPAIYDLNKLNWFNREYMKKLSHAELMTALKPYLSYDLSSLGSAKTELLIDAIRNNIDKYSDINRELDYFFDDISIADDLKPSLVEGKALLEKLVAEFDSFDFNSPEQIKNRINEIGESLGLKGKKLFWPIRIAVSARTHGPDLGLVFAVLGAEKIMQRLQNLYQP